MTARPVQVHPQVIVVEHGFLAGLFLAEKLGLPSVAFFTTPPVVPSENTAPVGSGLAPGAAGGELGIQSALAAGIAVIVSCGTDTTLEASARLEWAGADLCLHSPDPAAEDIARAAHRVLLRDDEHRNG